LGHPGQLKEEVILAEAASAATPTIRQTRDLPPNGVFPATIHYQPDTADKRLNIDFDVEWKIGNVFPFRRRINPRSDRGRKFLAVLRNRAGLGPSDDDRELDGKRVSVSGEQRYLRGKLTWVAKRFLKPQDARVHEEAEPCIEPDYADDLATRMLKKLGDAKFGRDGENVLILLPNRKPILIDPHCPDYGILQHRCTGLGTVEYKGRVLAQRLQFQALQLAENLRRIQFSFADREQVLVPIEGGKILQITADGFSQVDNGRDGIWLEHPRGKPLPWNAEADPREGLGMFEDLLVQSLLIRSEAMRFVLAMALGVFPLLRQRVTTRPLLEANGLSGHGKSTGCERFLHLYGLGIVKGNYSVAQLERDGDVGFIVLDNVETVNLTRLLEDFLLFSATGGEWGRVGAGKNPSRPVVAVTTIEGVARRSEVNRRLIRFEFQRTVPEWEENDIREKIEVQRAVIFRGIAELLRRFLTQNPRPKPKIIPASGFTDYCVLVYQLLRAWSEVMEKPIGFADSIFEAWAGQQATEGEEDSAGVYPRLLEMLITCRDTGYPNDSLQETIKVKDGYIYGEHTGRLFIATPNGWLSSLKEITHKDRDVRLPGRAEGLRKRLKELKPEHGYLLLTETDDKATLARHGSRRLWGILEIVTAAKEPTQGVS
jgi:hypothetical protein